MEYSIYFCLLIIIYLLWRKNDIFISSHSNDWIIRVSYKIFKDLDLEGKIKDTNVVDNKISIEFVPIIGWKYNHWSHKYGKMTPITPPFYGGKNILTSSSGDEITLYWFRDGGEYQIDTEWTSRSDFWEDLTNWKIYCGYKIVIDGTIPDSFQNRVQKILEQKYEGEPEVEVM